MTGSDISLEDLAPIILAYRGADQKVAITSHIRPDGDAIGSALGLFHVLNGLGIQAQIIDLGPIPNSYSFLLDNIDILDSAQLQPQDYSLLIILDTGSIDRAPEFAQQWAQRIPTINIDHHPTNTKFAHNNCIIPDASAVAEIVTRLADGANWDIPQAAATALWVGIVTDTGRFAYSCTTPATLQAAAALLAGGVNTQDVDQYVFQSTTIGALRLQAFAVNQMQFLQGGRLAIIPISQDDFRACGATTDDAEEIVNIPRRLETVEVSVYITEIPESKPQQPRTKASIRTKPPYDAGALCAALGGGGHARAAGCELALSLENAKESILASIQKAWFAS